MSKNDLYAIKEAYRRKLYEEAYESAEAKAWRDSLAPAERERAEALGLLQALPDTDVSSRSLDTIPLKMQPQEIMEIESEEQSVAAPLRNKLSKNRAEILTTLGMQDVQELQAFLTQGGNPKLRAACLNYLLDQGSTTIEECAKKMGMSKQAFHYHVRQIEKQLGLPPMGNQRKQSSRESYRLGNRRR